jgi:hypothetical protein
LQTVRLLFSLAVDRAGNMSADRIAATAITTSNSTKVNPAVLHPFFLRLRVFAIHVRAEDRLEKEICSICAVNATKIFVRETLLHEGV